MSKILILGGTGYTGKRIARHLLEQSDACITLAARNLDKAQAFAEELNQQYAGQRVAIHYADASAAESLRLAFAGHQIVVVASPTTAYAENVIRSSIDMRLDYLDVQLGRQKFALLQSLAAQIELAGLCYITEAGFHPGLPAALARYAAMHLDVLESAIMAGYLNMGKHLPYSEAVDELIEIFKKYDQHIYRGGQWIVPDSYPVRKINFGGDIGWRRCYAMFFEELRPLPTLFPSLRETGFYISETHWMLDWVIMPLTFISLKVAPRAVRSIGKFLWWGMQTFHRPPYRVELQVQATGIKDGHPAGFKACVSHPDGYDLTAIPVVAALLQYLDGAARKPGVWMMGHCIEPARLMKDMQGMGVKVACEMDLRQ